MRWVDAKTDEYDLSLISKKQVSVNMGRKVAIAITLENRKWDELYGAKVAICQVILQT